MAISRPIKLSIGLDVGQDPLLHNFLKSFLRERLRALQLFPAWDLSFVCSLLLKRPLSPCLRSVSSFSSLRWFISPFWLLVADAGRYMQLPTGPLLIYRTGPMWHNQVLGFISKTQLRSKGASALEPITIPSLGHTLGQDLAEDRHLCPVRCLKVYPARRKPFIEGKRLLFISYKKNKTSDISKNTITGWTRALLHLVYSNSNKDAAGRSTHAT